jgi:hypothetical protein
MPYFEEDFAYNHRTVAAKVAAELNIHQYSPWFHKNNLTKASQFQHPW